MGPNLYVSSVVTHFVMLSKFRCSLVCSFCSSPQITPPASFTYFHQDGHGTVDSGHLCVSGFNEIIMLRRLTERHKKHAMWLLTGDRKRPDSYFDGLYEEPHGDGLVRSVWISLFFRLSFILLVRLTDTILAVIRTGRKASLADKR